MEMSNECKLVVDSVKLLSLHNEPAMFWLVLQERTKLGPDHVGGIMRRWALGIECSSSEYGLRLSLISDALDIQSESIYGCSWDELCGMGAWSAICEIGEIQ